MALLKDRFGSGAPVPEGRPESRGVMPGAAVTAEQRLRVQRAQDLLKSLPSGTTPALKREIVEAALLAFDIQTREIVRTATIQIAALNGSIEQSERLKQQAIEQAERRIAELESQIAAVRDQTEKAVAAQEAQQVLHQWEIANLEPILEFFVQEGDPPVESEPAQPVAPPPPPPKRVFEMPAPLSLGAGQRRGTRGT